MPPTPPITVSLSTSLPIVADGSLPADVTLTFSQPVTDEQIQANLKGRAIYDGNGSLISVNEDMYLCEPGENIFGSISTSAEPSNTRTLHFSWPHGSTGHTFRITSIGWGDYTPLTFADYDGIRVPVITQAMLNAVLAEEDRLPCVITSTPMMISCIDHEISVQRYLCTPAESNKYAQFANLNNFDDLLELDGYSCGVASYDVMGTVQDLFISSIPDFDYREYTWVFGPDVTLDNNHLIRAARDV